MKSICITCCAAGLLLGACGTGNTNQRPGSITGLVVSPGGNVGAQSVGTLPVDAELIPTRHVPSESIVAGEVIVKFKQGLGLQSVQSLSVDGKTAALLRPTAIEQAGLYRAKGLDVQGTIELAKALAGRPDVEYAEPNAMDYILRTPNDEFYGAQWHYPLINMPAAWDKTIGSASVVVAVIDTGIIKHPDLDLKILPGYDFIGNLADAGDGDGRDPNPLDVSSYQSTSNHGSHVAGTVAAFSNNTTGVAGVSWNSKIVPLRTLGVKGSGSMTDIADAIIWAAGGSVAGVPANANPVQVINMSLGGKGACTSLYQDAINQATQRGAIVVVAAGNENDDTSLYRPASCDNTITVGAVGPQGTRAPYSNYGTSIDIMAPGGDINQRIEFGGKSYAAGVLSTSAPSGGPGYAFLNGTSMASPHVAGIVALMKSQNPGLNYTQALAQLKASAKPLDATQCNRPSEAECGPGLVDVAKALGGGATPPPPPPPPAQSINTLVVAFFCTTVTCLDPNGELAVDLNKSRSTTIKQTKTRTSYSIANLTPGTYLAAGWQDLNGNEDVDDNEPLGVYPGQVFVDPGLRVRDVDIPLEPFKVTNQSGLQSEATLRRNLGRWLQNHR